MKTERINARVSAEMLKKIKELSPNMSAFINAAIAEKLKREGAKQ